MTPPLECPHCHGATWVRGEPDGDAVCAHCGSAAVPLPRRLVSAVRERFARDARLNRGRPRFVRERR